MKNNIVEFREDPMMKIDELNQLENKILYLNEIGMDELKSYSTIILNSYVPKEFSTQFLGANEENTFFLKASAGIDEEGREFPETYFAIENTKDEDFPYKILGLYSFGNHYIFPKVGEEVYLKMVKGKMMIRGERTGK